MYKFVDPRQTSPLADGCRLISHRYPCLYVTFLYLSGFNDRCNVAACHDVVEVVFLLAFRWQPSAGRAPRGRTWARWRPWWSPVGWAAPGSHLQRSQPVAQSTALGCPGASLLTWNSSLTFVCKYLFKTPTGVPCLNVDRGCSVLRFKEIHAFYGQFHIVKPVQVACLHPYLYWAVLSVSTYHSEVCIFYDCCLLTHLLFARAQSSCSGSLSCLAMSHLCLHCRTTSVRQERKANKKPRPWLAGVFTEQTFC